MIKKIAIVGHGAVGSYFGSLGSSFGMSPKEPEDKIMNKGVVVTGFGESGLSAAEHAAYIKIKEVMGNDIELVHITNQELNNPEILKERGITLVMDNSPIKDSILGGRGSLKELALKNLEKSYTELNQLSNDFDGNIRGDNKTDPSKIDVVPKVVLPKGCNWYYFSADGNLVEQNVLFEFKCIASNFTQAKNKFDKYNKNK